MEDLNGKKTANTISSTYAAQAEAYGATVTGVDDLNQTIELLLSSVSMQHLMQKLYLTITRKSIRKQMSRLQPTPIR